MVVLTRLTRGRQAPNFYPWNDPAGRKISSFIYILD